MTHFKQQSLAEQAEVLVTRVRRLSGNQVSSKSFRNAVRGFVQSYFSTFRANLPLDRCPSLVSSLDSCFQDLLRCTHRRSVKTKYVYLLKEITNTVREIEVQALSAATERDHTRGIRKRERLIVDTLQKLVPTAAASLEQGIRDLSSGERVSWRGTVVEFRESLREALDYLAPDADVMSMPGHTPQKGTSGPTMKQKALFILKSRRTPSPTIKSVVDTVVLVDDRVSSLVRSVYQRASTATHGTVDKNEASRIRDYVFLVLAELLEIET